MTGVSLYEPLADIEYIRLLRVKRDVDGGISAQLQNVCLSSKSCPGFLTFSYAWGPSNFTKTIKLQGQHVAVLDSVYDLLEVVCDGNGFAPDAWLWIDSICINQKDLAERGQQVAIMGKIYRQAHKTVVWLGAGTPETDQGMDFMHRLAKEVDRLFEEYRTSHADRQVPARLADPAPWRALGAVLDKAWWRRVWTLQEFIIAPHLNIYCGTRRISRTRFKDAIYALWLCSPGEQLIKGALWGTTVGAAPPAPVV